MDIGSMLITIIFRLIMVLIPSTAVPASDDRPFNSFEEITELFQVRRTTTDLSVIGHHVVGEVTVEIEALDGVDIQVQWSTLVTTTVDDVNRQHLPSNAPAGSMSFNLSSSEKQTTISSTYMVPIVGDSWCSIQETSWSSMESGLKHLTSSLDCRRLPATGNGKSIDPRVVVAVKALNGAVKFQRHLSNEDHAPSFDWRLPNLETISRTTQVKSEENVTLVFSIAVQCNPASRPPSARVVWISDTLPISHVWIAEILLPTAINDSNGNAVECHMYKQPYAPFDGNWSGGSVPPIDVMCNVTATPDGFLVALQVFIQSADAQVHPGTFSASFSRDETFVEAVSLFTDLVIVAADYNAVVDSSLERKSAVTSEPVVLRMRTCSRGTSAPWLFDNDGVAIEVPMRTSVADCVVCVVDRRLSSFLSRMPIGTPEVRITRADGLILGSEESHSVYWYREPSRRGSAVVLLLRTPTDEYNGDYVCSTPGLTPKTSSSAAGFKHLSSKFRAKSIRFTLNVRQ